MMKRVFFAAATLVALAVAWPQGQANQEQGWAVRAAIKNPGALYNTAKKKLLEGKPIYSFAIGRRDPELYCQVAPHYDYIWFEMQHSTMSYADVEAMIAACPRAGMPMIRVPDELESSMQKATDIGAIGIIMPTVDTVEKAQAAVKYSLYPPQGRRSQGAGQAPQIWGVNGINYRQPINETMLIIAMIETPDGVKNALNIAKVPGVDVVMGANTDLTNFSGFPPTDQRYAGFFTQIHDATLKAGKYLGATTPAYASTGPNGRPDAADFRVFYTGPSFDGFQPPGRGAGRGRGNPQ